MNDSYGRDLDLNLLRVFAVVAEEGNVTRAAARLYVTQPAVSAALRRLATALGAPLFVRQGHGVALTARGRELLAASRAHLRPLVAAALAEPVFDPRTTSATIRLGIIDGMETTLVPRLVAHLAQEAPRMRLVVLHAQFRTVEALVLRDAADLAVCVADELPRSIERLPLVSAGDTPEGFACLYDPRHARLPGRLTERAYFAAEHVAVSYAGDTRGIVEDVLGRPRDVRVAVPSLGLVAEIVDGTSLLGTIPMLLARHVLRTRPHLRYAPLPFALGGGSLDLLWARARRDDEVVRFARGLVTRIVADLVAEVRAAGGPPRRRVRRADR